LKTFPETILILKLIQVFWISTQGNKEREAYDEQEKAISF